MMDLKYRSLNLFVCLSATISKQEVEMKAVMNAPSCSQANQKALIDKK